MLEPPLDTQPAFHFEFDFTPDDLQQLTAAALAQQWRTTVPPPSRMFLLMSLVSGAVSALSAINGDWLFAAIAGYAAIMFLWMFRMFRRPDRMSQRAARRAIRSSDSRFLCGPQQVWVRADEITHIDPCTRTHYSWSGFSGLQVKGELVLLFRPNARALGFPLRAFETADQQRAFIAFVERQIALLGYQSPTKA